MEMGGRVDRDLWDWPEDCELCFEDGELTEDMLVFGSAFICFDRSSGAGLFELLN